ncbi:hypothetical protein L6452_34922 [Arctium lappa]|uniref:Uncharacterized protein n=1 Tax=Arctium lappa TaxID=4217 RepID=A0ACB8YJI5_ARCLA|nr:hypothetical protein L6452_34922 [Arctium lappa]
MMNYLRKAQKEVKYMSKIVTVKEVRLKKFIRLWYSVSTVQRRNMLAYTFTKADFPNLNFDDLEHMYHLFREITIRKENITFSIESIKRFIRRHIYYTYWYDFQLGLETNQKSVNMLKLDMTIPDLEDYPLFTVLENPEFGVV